MDKEDKIRAFIDAIENIVASKVVGLDFIALGDDDSYFQDYLLHNKPVSDYLDALALYFKDYPSLLITNLIYEVQAITTKNEVIAPSDVELKFKDEKVDRANFEKNNEVGKEQEYWGKWCGIISKFYPYCGSVLFLKLDFEELDQTTALFIYFDNNISDIDSKSEGWLKEKLNVFLYEEAISYFLPKHIQRIEEIGRLKTKTMFSLTTHSLKTHLNTTVVKTKNAFNDKLKEHPILKEDFKEHSREVDTLFNLTELLSLIDKIDDPKKFKEAATKVLFTDTKVSYNLKEHLDKFNRRHNAFPDLISIPTIEKFEFNLTIYDLYFGEKLLELFFNTIFENVLAYGKPNTNRKKELRIDLTENHWIFKNDTEDEEVSVDEEKLTGNLELYRKLINETKSGLFSINTGAYTFEIIIKKNIL